MSNCLALSVWNTALLLISKKPTSDTDYRLARNMLDIVLSKCWYDLEPLNLSETMWQKIVEPVRRDNDLEKVLITLIKAKLVRPELVMQHCKVKKTSIKFSSPQWRELAPELALNTQERLSRQALLRKLAE